jgi:glutaconate CoA-transferase subunit A
MPVAGLHGSDLPAASGFRAVADPYTGEEVYVIPRLAPDVAVLHVQEADALGNARIYGSPFWDRLMSRAAARVIITAERIVPTAELARLPELTAVPAFLVDAVVAAPGGAWPGSCHGHYGIAEAAVRDYLAHAHDPAWLRDHLAAADTHLPTPEPAGYA